MRIMRCTKQQLPRSRAPPTYMAVSDDDSWEVAAQAALDIHRRTISAVRDRVTKGAIRRKARSKTTSAAFENARPRPMSAPNKYGSRSSRSGSGHILTPNGHILTPNLANLSTVNISRAELEAWATLTRAFDDEPSNQPKSTGMPSKPRQNSYADGIGRATSARSKEIIHPEGFITRKPKKIDMTFEHLQRLDRSGKPSQQLHNVDSLRGATSPRQSKSKRSDAFGRAVDDSCIDLRRSSGFSSPRPLAQDLVRHRVALAEGLAAQKRQHEQGRSDVSIRFLREYAKKTSEENKTFGRILRAEAEAKEESQIENINRANERSRYLGVGVLYLPHRISGKLHVLKTEKNKMSTYGGGRGGSGHLVEPGKVISVESFMKTVYARLEKDFYASRDAAIGEKSKVVATPSKFKGPIRKKKSSKSAARPNAGQTRRELHKLIRDTAVLTEVLTAQAVEIEGQDWNREPRTRRVQRKGPS